MDIKVGDEIIIKVKIEEVRITALDTIYKVKTISGISFNDTLLIQEKDIVKHWRPI